MHPIVVMLIKAREEGRKLSSKEIQQRLDLITCHRLTRPLLEKRLSEIGRGKPMIRVELIRLKGKPISIGVGTNVFPIEKGKVQHNEDSRQGCVAVDSGLIPGNATKGNESRYLAAYELAKWAFENNVYDSIVDNDGLR